ncbi:hypothetical protein EJ05DRAFT_473055 [Pseudovirgaria hyperparasitica]|uniref:Zn(2)-C6 fungal-type domain-containing protein n=1 Tax=Pseudovirgaria hyperparasitica TaxID=470096 RepID=A0A6A6WJ15_9PEZI|nr:uncharacterized protein EJ05DRAFT_473055 [Pseudovirgaria hyperparasitica]KAF2762116.1 hypothetical protein EJ05DRAFT_473055 [Pseudovirgaria hyperparasitica]
MNPQQMPAAAASSSAATAPKRTRRPRAIQACNFCRSKKYKCDGAWPCAPCQSKSRMLN